MSFKTDKILEFCEENDIEIISYGLAPSPFGFCFECGEKTSLKAMAKVDSILNSLSSRQTRELREYLNGEYIKGESK